MPAFIAALIVPIPLIHLWLHALLPWWRRQPWLFYLWGLVLWAGSFKLIPLLDDISPAIFDPGIVTQRIGTGLIWLGLVGLFASLISLGPERFFVWAVLDAESAQRNRASGVFALVPHPAYLGYIAIAFGIFLWVGKLYLAMLLIYLIVLTPIVIWLEEQEMEERFQ